MGLVTPETANVTEDDQGTRPGDRSKHEPVASSDSMRGPLPIIRAARRVDRESSRRNRRRLPEWYPAWAKELADLYFSGTTYMFVLHGNVHDLVRCPRRGRRATSFVSLTEFLATQVFGTWDVVLSYDLSRGLRAVAGERRPSGCKRWCSTSAGDLGGPAAWPRDPDKVLDLLGAALAAQPAGRQRRQSQEHGVHLRVRPVPAAGRRSGSRWPAARPRGWCGFCAGRRIRTSSG